MVEQAVSDNVPEETVREALPEASVPVHDLHQKTVGDEKNQAVVSNRRSGGVRLFAGIMSAVMLCCACVVLALYWDSLFLERRFCRKDSLTLQRAGTLHGKTVQNNWRL